MRTALVWAAGLGTVVALYGLFSYLTVNARLLWLPRRFYLDCVTGTFVNRNNFATLMVLLLPALLACYWTRPPARSPVSDRGDATARAGFFILCGAAMGLALLFSRSRGGIVCGMLSLGALTLGLRRYGGRPGRALAILPIVLGAVVAAWAAYIGVEGVVDRFLQLVSGGDSAAGRGAQWADTFRAVRDFPILGSGLGTYAFHCPFYKTLRTQAVFDHAHNDYLELLSEVGIVGLGLCAWGIIRFASTTASVSAAGQRRPALVVWTPAAGVAGVLLHRLAALTPWFAQLPLRGPQPESADPIKLLASNADTAARERHDDWPC